MVVNKECYSVNNVTSFKAQTKIKLKHMEEKNKPGPASAIGKASAYGASNPHSNTDETFLR